MKKKLFLIVSALFVWMSAFADNIVSVSSVSGQPGDEVEITLTLGNTDAIVAAEVRIPLSRYVQYVEESAILNTERSNGHYISASGEGNMLKLYIYSIGNKAFKGNSGTLATLRLRLGKYPEELRLKPDVLLSDATGQPLMSNTQEGIVTILTPYLNISTSTINYGHVPIRSQYMESLVVSNTGTVTLHINDITTSAQELTVEAKPFELAPGEIRYITLEYNPTKRGAITETVSIMSDAINGKQKAIVVAAPYSVNELHVGNAQGNSDTDIILPITMNNMEPITGIQCSFMMPDGLKLLGVETGSHAAGLTAMSTVKDSKLTLFLYSSNNTVIPEGDGEVLRLRLRLDGESGEYWLEPMDVVLSNITMENMVSATSSGYVQIQSPKIIGNEELCFGSIPVTEKAEQQYCIENSGATDLVVNKVTFLAEGYSIKQELPITITPWSSTTLTICYQPTSEGNHSTTMNIYSNDPNSRLKAVNVNSSVYEPNELSVTGEWADANKSYYTNIRLDNYTNIVGAQMDLHIPTGITVNVSNALSATSRLNGLSATMVKVSESVYRIVVFSLNNTVISGNTGDIITIKTEVDDAAAVSKKQIYIDNIVLSNLKGKNYSSSSSCSLTIEEVLDEVVLGDVNDDETVNILDVLATLGIMKGNDGGYNHTAADANSDGTVNILDVLKILEIMKNK